MITLTCDVHVFEWGVVHAGYLDLDLYRHAVSHAIDLNECRYEVPLVV